MQLPEMFSFLKKKREEVIKKPTLPDNAFIVDKMPRLLGRINIYMKNSDYFLRGKNFCVFDENEFIKLSDEILSSNHFISGENIVITSEIQRISWYRDDQSCHCECPICGKHADINPCFSDIVITCNHCGGNNDSD